ncbi:dTDP-4-dehydrorhamnose reductase [Prochlorococcus sp. AH-736-L23]|nr:dTDP-4-dehydrorhamnose reductase [Prochlorococcus sp. AH-736-L23]
MIKVLLTGSSGQLGHSLIKSKPANICLITPNRKELDLSNPKECFDKTLEIKPDWILNCAAYTAVDLAESNHELCFRINKDAPKYFAKALNIVGGNLIQISTDYVFNGTQNYPYQTDQIKNPINIYGKSKAEGEDEIQKEMKNPKNYYILRTSWLMGQKGGNFSSNIIELLSKKDKIDVVSDQFGSPTTTISLANVLWELISKDKFIKQYNLNKYPIYHWTDDGITSWYDLALEIYSISSKLGLIEKNKIIRPIKSSNYKTNARRPLFSVLDCNSTQKLLNIKRIPWQKSIHQMLLEKLKEKNLNI